MHSFLSWLLGISQLNPGLNPSNHVVAGSCYCLLFSPQRFPTHCMVRNKLLWIVCMTFHDLVSASLTSFMFHSFQFIFSISVKWNFLKFPECDIPQLCVFPFTILSSQNALPFLMHHNQSFLSLIKAFFSSTKSFVDFLSPVPHGTSHSLFCPSIILHLLKSILQLFVYICLYGSSTCSERATSTS